ncbi:MAG: SurA N-terminal domain-containing protein [Polyangiaceae bacterium]|jgi:peptidyl-prolyl cis-trans isomerase SurA
MPSVKLARLLAALAMAATLFGAGAAHATIVERVVAVIGERPVLWTDLLHRAQAGRVQIRMQTHDTNVISVQEQEMYKEVLDRMIDDRLEEQHADRSHIAVTPEEIDRGIENIAAQAQAQQGRAVTPADVFEEVHRRGLSEQDFRDEIRRQILEGKLVELRVRPRVRVTDNDARSAYQHWVQQLRDQEPVDVRILALRVPPMATKLQLEARTVLAQEIVGRARDGEDFCRLVAQYSDDVSTKDACGSHGAQPIANLLPPIQEAIHTMKPGTISDPIPVAAGQEEVIVILMPLGEARVPPFEDVKSDMTQRALLEGLERARKQWLQELRRNVYIDVRL